MGLWVRVSLAPWCYTIPNHLPAAWGGARLGVAALAGLQRAPGALAAARPVDRRALHHHRRLQLPLLILRAAQASSRPGAHLASVQALTWHHEINQQGGPPMRRGPFRTRRPKPARTLQRRMRVRAPGVAGRRASLPVARRAGGAPFAGSSLRAGARLQAAHEAQQRAPLVGLGRHPGVVALVLRHQHVLHVREHARRRAALGQPPANRLQLRQERVVARGDPARRRLCLGSSARPRAASSFPGGCAVGRGNPVDS